MIRACWYRGVMALRHKGKSPTDPKLWLRFVQVGSFAQSWKGLGLGDAALRELEMLINVDPAAAPVIVGTGGLRKIRFAPSSWRTGKSGAVRVYYALFVIDGTILLIHAHDKTTADTMPAEEKRVVKAIIDRAERAFQQSRARSGPL